MTFSGGEPFAQRDTLLELARRCMLSGISTAVETSGFFSLDQAIGIFEWLEDVFIDLKHSDDKVHRELTGVSNQEIIHNILRLDQMGRALTVRAPLVRGLTDTADNIAGIIKVCAQMQNLIAVELLPYHNFGAGKYEGLGLHYDSGLSAPEPAAIQEIMERFHAHGIKVICAGREAERPA